MVDYAHLELEKHGDIWLARLQDAILFGELPLHAGEELYSLAAEPDCQRLVVNLSRVTRMSSEMFGKLIMLNKRMTHKGGRFNLCEICPDIRLTLAETQLDQLFDIRETEAAALAAFEAERA